MTTVGGERRAVIDWGWAGRALEALSGDLHVVVVFPGGALVALLDGLGHGAEAAEAAARGASCIEARAGAPLPTIVAECHEGLHGTRGVVLSAASFDARSSVMTWLGVGNVDAVLRRARPGDAPDEALGQRPGVVGYQLPPLHCVTLPVYPGDTLIMATDGIRSGFANRVALEHSPQEIAEAILARFTKGSDDARVVVARYVGDDP